MKRILLVLACTVLSAALFGCGGGGGSGTGLDPVTNPTPTPSPTPIPDPVANSGSSFSGTFTGTPPAFTTVLRMNVKTAGTIAGHTDNYQTGGAFTGTINNTTGVFTATQNSGDPSDITLQGTVDANGTVTGTWVNKIDSLKTGSFTCTKIAATAQRFTDTGKGTVYDAVSNLTWLKDASCFGALGLNWIDANAAAKVLASGQNKCGLTDGSVAGSWRLPSRDELQTLLDDGYLSTTLITVGFSNVQSDFYWSGTPYLFNPDTHAWSVDMFNGSLADFAGMNMGSTYNVWLVRNGQ